MYRTAQRVALVCLVAAWSLGCSNDEANNGEDRADMSTADSSSTADTSSAGGDVGDDSDAGGADAGGLCFEGWSGDSGCCLEGNSQPASADGCPDNYFTSAECDRLDPICEGVAMDMGPEPDLPTSEVAQTTLEVVNMARAEEQDCGADGMLGPSGQVALDARLTEAAQRHADDMATSETLAFIGSDGSTTSERASDAGYVGVSVIETVGNGQATAQEAIDSFIAGDGTCRNIMFEQATDLGVGYAESADSTPFWSIVLGYE